MARSDLLVTLVGAASRSDQILLRRTVEAIAAEERAKQHHILADRLLDELRPMSPPVDLRARTKHEPGSELVVERTPRWQISDLILPYGVRDELQQMAEEHNRADLLRSFGLEPRHRVLLVGPPGNGKTSLAEAIAEALMVPMIIVRYESLIGSYLGETGNRLRSLFDYLRNRECLVFFDEFEVLGKERADEQETGEIKRVVSGFLLQLDALPSYVTVVAATNHPELLDRAVWRRFQLRLHLPPPGQDETLQWVEQFQARFDQPLGYSPKMLAGKLQGLSFAELEEFGTNVRRRYVLELPNSDPKHIIAKQLSYLSSRFNLAGEGVM